MTLELKHFINPDPKAKEFACVITDGVKRKDDDGKRVLRFELGHIKLSDFHKYEVYPDGSSAKAIIPTVKIRK